MNKNGRPRTDVLERFWKKVDKRGQDECWEWLGSCPNRYGQFYTRMEGSKRLRVKAHRFSWEIANADVVPLGLLVLHSCDNPPCVNPNHLFLGTSKDNAQDKIAKGRDRGLSAERRKQTHCKRGHLFDDKNTYLSSRKQRICRKCHALHQATLRATRGNKG